MTAYHSLLKLVKTQNFQSIPGRVNQYLPENYPTPNWNPNLLFKKKKILQKKKKILQKKKGIIEENGDSKNSIKIEKILQRIVAILIQNRMEYPQRKREQRSFVLFLPSI